MGSALGKLIRRLPLAYVRIARRNIELCLPALSSLDRESMVERHCQSLGMGLCETANTWWSSDRKVNALAEIQGLENLHAALAKGRGAIMIGGHFTTIEIATRIWAPWCRSTCCTVRPKTRCYRILCSPASHATASRSRYDDIRTMIRALKNNEAVWYAPDQSYRNKGAAMVNYFGIPAATNTATSRLARISGAAVLTYFPERLPGNAGYRVVIGPALGGFSGANVICDVERFNRLLEAQIRRVPEQYLWVHRRFKGLGDAIATTMAAIPAIVGPCRRLNPASDSAAKACAARGKRAIPRGASPSAPGHTPGRAANHPEPTLTASALMPEKHGEHYDDSAHRHQPVPDPKSRKAAV